MYYFYTKNKLHNIYNNYSFNLYLREGSNRLNLLNYNKYIFFILKVLVLFLSLRADEEFRELET